MKPDPRVHIFVLIDALGWRLLQGRDFLPDLLPYRQPLRTILGYSSGAIPAILTGLAPAANGQWNAFYYDPQGSPFRWLRRLRFLPDSVLNHRVSRKLLKELGRRVLGMGPLFECCVSPRLLPWFNWVEKRNIYAAGGIPGARSIFDELAASGVAHRVYSYHGWTDQEILAQAAQDVASSGASFFFLYLCQLDAALHYCVQDESEVGRRLDWYAAALRRLFEAARRRDPQAGLAVFSDHGMTPVRRHYDLVPEVERLGFAMPGDYLAVYDSTMARFWFFSERARRGICECLDQVPCGRILPDEELGELGILFPDRRYGEVIFLMQPGCLLSHSNFNHSGKLAGMHGYHPDDPHSDAVFLSSDEPAAPLRTIADIFQSMHAAVTSRDDRYVRATH